MEPISGVQECLTQMDACHAAFRQAATSRKCFRWAEIRQALRLSARLRSTDEFLPRKRLYLRLALAFALAEPELKDALVEKNFDKLTIVLRKLAPSAVPKYKNPSGKPPRGYVGRVLRFVFCGRLRSHNIEKYDRRRLAQYMRVIAAAVECSRGIDEPIAPSEFFDTLLAESNLSSLEAIDLWNDRFVWNS
jgi:hypothetical protein